MKLLGVLVALVTLAVAAPLSEYLEYLMGFDFEAMLKNDEQRKIIFDCMLGKSSCGEYKALNDAVIKVVQNKCAECTPEQKQKYDRIIKITREQFEPFYKEFVKKIDRNE